MTERENNFLCASVIRTGQKAPDAGSWAVIRTGEIPLLILQKSNPRGKFPSQWWNAGTIAGSAPVPWPVARMRENGA